MAKANRKPSDNVSQESLPPTNERTDKKPTKFFFTLRFLKTDEWIALLALLVSIYTIYSSDKQFRTTSQFNAQQQDQAILHDKLSVKPLLQFNAEYTKASPWVGLSVINKGIGPAIVIKMDKKYKQSFFKNWGDLTPFLNQRGAKFWKSQTPFWNELKDGQAISPNEEVRLWFMSDNNVSDYVVADSVINDLRIELKYTNIYNDTFKTMLP
jgi:hypothetical protein